MNKWIIAHVGSVSAWYWRKIISKGTSLWILRHRSVVFLQCSVEWQQVKIDPSRAHLKCGLHYWDPVFLKDNCCLTYTNVLFRYNAAVFPQIRHPIVRAKNVFSVASLPHWGRVTHICVGNLNIIGSDNGLSPVQRQAIIWRNVGILLIGPW